MLKPSLDPAALLTWVSYLERQQRFLRPVAVLAMLATGAALVAFATQTPAGLQTQRLELVDAKGQIQAALAADTTGVLLTIIGKNGRVTGSLHLNDDPRLALRDATGREVAGLGAPRVLHLVQ
jgi:hypothetical protein